MAALGRLLADAGSPAAGRPAGAVAPGACRHGRRMTSRTARRMGGRSSALRIRVSSYRSTCGAMGAAAACRPPGPLPSQPDFREQVDKTLFLPTEQYGYQGTRNVGTLDDGGRFQTWDHEARKLDNAPIFGTGMWHRGGSSGLWTTGSHNYWLQMFLETGVVGGCSLWQFRADVAQQVISAHIGAMRTWRLGGGAAASWAVGR